MEVVKVDKKLVTETSGFDWGEGHKGGLFGFDGKVELLWFKSGWDKAEVFWGGVGNRIYNDKGMIPSVEVEENPAVSGVFNTVVTSETAEKLIEKFHIVPRR